MTGPDILALSKGLQVGDLLNGHITRLLDSSRVMVSLRGSEWRATTPIPLAEGQQIKGVVQAKGPPLVLRLVVEEPSDKARIFIRFKSLAARWLPTTKDHPAVVFSETMSSQESELTKPLNRWLNDFALGGQTGVDPHRVRAALIHGGLFYERSVREWIEAGGEGVFDSGEIDLKGVALKLLAGMDDPSAATGRSSDTSIRPLESLIGKIELFQTASWLAQEEGLGFVFQIPLDFDGNLRTADLMVGFPREKEGKKDGLRILVLLNMGDLGCFQMDVKIHQKGVAVAIGLDREETLALVRSLAGELRKGLEDQKLTVLEIACFLLERPTTKEEFFEQLLSLDEGGVVNIRV
jgi:hypothetical protein